MLIRQIFHVRHEEGTVYLWIEYWYLRQFGIVVNIH